MESSIDTMDESKPRKRVVTEARRAQNRVAQMAYREWLLLDTVPHISADLKDRATAEGKTVAKSSSTSRTHCGEEGV
jgi:hypothetical protein